MKNCIFCKIARGENDENYRIFYSDSLFYAMFVNNPDTKGHFILVTKKHYSQMSEFDNPGVYFSKAIALAEEKTQRLKAEAFTLKFNNNVYKVEDDARHVSHLHIHIIPKYKDNVPIKLIPKKDYFKALKNTIK